jgi:multiple sugar transport system permease protein
MKKYRDYRLSEVRAGILFTLPVVIIFIFLRIIPALAVFYYSFTNYSIMNPPVWNGLGNYISLINDSAFFEALGNSMIFTAGTVIPSAFIGLFFANILNKKLILVGFYRAIYYVPQVVSWVAISMIWIYLLNPSYGVFNWIFSTFGLPKLQWLFEPNLAMFTVIMVSIWRNVGYTIVIYLAGLQGLDETLYEAAEMDGCSSWNKFRHITFPLLMPITTYVFVITSIFSLQAFDQIYVLTYGGPADSTVTAVYSVWRQAFQYAQMGYASAQAVIIFFVICALSLITLKLLNRNSIAN